MLSFSVHRAPPHGIRFGRVLRDDGPVRSVVLVALLALEGGQVGPELCGVAASAATAQDQVVSAIFCSMPL